jgi:hypothetical protein
LSGNDSECEEPCPVPQAKNKNKKLYDLEDTKPLEGRAKVEMEFLPKPT